MLSLATYCEMVFSSWLSCCWVMLCFQLGANSQFSRCVTYVYEWDVTRKNCEMKQRSYFHQSLHVTLSLVTSNLV
jgi:hypothetical protein